MSQTEQPKPAGVATREIELAAPHRHAGKPYKKGDKLRVAKTLIPWLRKRNLIVGEQSGPVNQGGEK